ncbi:MAG: aminomethyl-transferring glycine dehydrogenase subunit GcvPA, partial [Alphaproteobacteria bacterium]|nr:aminomethyl-transferring glycine dehydrogenase subunit GcvPA [Alphaproteobacteria bacterium]
MRYLPLTEADRAAMLARIGAPSVDALFDAIPAGQRYAGAFDLPDHQGELAVERRLAGYARRNLAAGDAPSFLGAGAYRHHVPASVDHLVQRGEFLTAYTPYQPEISQGTLQALFEFQTQVALLTGMEVANASMYDGATSCAEAVLMARRVTGRNRAVLSGNLHPHWRDAVTTLARWLDYEIVVLPPSPEGAEDLSAAIDAGTACVVAQNPDAFGNLADLTPLAEACHAAGALLVGAVTEVVSLGAVEPPGAMGADIVVAEGQSLGNAMMFGGPHLGLFATRQKYLRQMPGRVCGQTVDTDGRRGFVLTLSTREQHIRREKATSNICTNSGLCALAFTIHLALLGERGLAGLAAVNHATAVRTAERLGAVPGVRVLSSAFFNEFALRLPRAA